MVNRKTPRRGGAAKTSTIERLRAAEAQDVLRLLLEAHPDLREEAEEIAKSKISGVSFESVAEDVAWELESHDVDEMNDRAGDSGSGYLDPADAAHEILQEAIDPIIDQMQRHLDLGLEREALETCKGLVLGLHEVRKRKNDGCLGWAEDFPEQTAKEVLEKWCRGIQGKGTKWKRTGLRSFLEAHAPKWGLMFDRVLIR